MELFTTQRGKPGLLYGGFKFRLDKTTNATKLWRCTKRGCQARCKTDLAGTVTLDLQNIHNHQPEQDEQLNRQKLRQNCKRKATEDHFERPSKIIRHEIMAEDSA